MMKLRFIMFCAFVLGALFGTASGADAAQSAPRQSQPKGKGGARTSQSDTIVINVAADPQQLGTRSVIPGRATVILVYNAAPRYRYHLQVSRSVKPIGAIAIPTPFDTNAQGVVKLDGINTSSDLCKDLNAALQALREEKEETAVPGLISAVEDAANEIARSDLSAEAKAKCAASKEVQPLIDSTRHAFKVDPLTNGMDATATLSRYGAPEGVASWTVGLATPGRGEWRTTYGFAFPWHTFAKERTYFLEQVDTTTKFVIREPHDTDVFDMVPSVFFTWLSNDRLLENVSFSPTVGLGLDVTEPVVMPGVSLMYNQNIGLNVGLVMKRQRVLSGNREVGDTVTSLISETELHVDRFRVNPYLAIAIRSVSELFKSPAQQ